MALQLAPAMPHRGSETAHGGIDDRVRRALYGPQLELVLMWFLIDTPSVLK
jgi:hypothetical protein